MSDENNDIDDLEEDLDVFERSPAETAVSLTVLRDLPPSGLLSVEDADAFLRWRSGSIIAIVGERNGGKTTLISEIYSQFLKGVFADLKFSHSLSLMGFEKKVFQSRAESGRGLPDTPRTSAQEGLSFFHLQLVDLLSGSSKKDLLVSERAGEIYKEIRDIPELAQNFIEIRKSDVIVLIVDGERVLNARERAGVFASIRNITRAILESGCVKKNTRIQLVTTKIDLLQEEGASKAFAALIEFEQNIDKIFGSIYCISIHRVAARDPQRRMAPAHGVAELLRSWIEPKLDTESASLQMPDLTSECEKLALRRT